MQLSLNEYFENIDCMQQSSTYYTLRSIGSSSLLLKSLAISYFCIQELNLQGKQSKLDGTLVNCQLTGTENYSSYILVYYF